MEEVYYPNLVAELARLNMSKTQLANEIGMAITTIYGKFKGASKWTLEDMEKIKCTIEKYADEPMTMDYLFMVQTKKN